MSASWSSFCSTLSIGPRGWLDEWVSDWDSDWEWRTLACLSSQAMCSGERLCACKGSILKVSVPWNKLEVLSAWSAYLRHVSHHMMFSLSPYLSQTNLSSHAGTKLRLRLSSYFILEDDVWLDCDSGWGLWDWVACPGSFPGIEKHDLSQIEMLRILII